MHGLCINSTSKSKTGQIPRPCYCSVGSVNLSAAHVLQKERFGKISSQRKLGFFFCIFHNYFEILCKLLINSPKRKYQNKTFFFHVDGIWFGGRNDYRLEFIWISIIYHLNGLFFLLIFRIYSSPGWQIMSWSFFLHHELGVCFDVWLECKNHWTSRELLIE